MARRKNFQALNITQSKGLATLVTDLVLFVDDVPWPLTQDFHLVSVDVVAQLVGLTPGEGPILLGWADNDLSATEVEESIDAVPVSQSDYINIERSRRPVRSIASFQGELADEVLNDGKAFRVKVNRTFHHDQSDFSFFVMQQSGGSLTTGAAVILNCKFYGYWK